MKVGTICQRLVSTVNRSDEVSAAARLMREAHVGYLVVVETDALGRVARPIGVLTDRDLVLTLLARDVIPSAVSVGDVMTANPVTIGDSDSIEDALQKMREHGVRRMPVVGERGDLMGVLSTDGILRVLAWDTQDLVTTNAVERMVEGTRGV